MGKVGDEVESCASDEIYAQCGKWGTHPTSLSEREGSSSWSRCHINHVGKGLRRKLCVILLVPDHQIILKWNQYLHVACDATQAFGLLFLEKQFIELASGTVCFARSEFPRNFSEELNLANSLNGSRDTLRRTSSLDKASSFKFCSSSSISNMCASRDRHIFEDASL